MDPRSRWSTRYRPKMVWIYLAGQAPDAVLLDINLPEMSGLEAFRHFTRLDPKLPVIFVTALDSSDVAIQAMTLGPTTS